MSYYDGGGGPKTAWQGKAGSHALERDGRAIRSLSLAPPTNLADAASILQIHW